MTKDKDLKKPKQPEQPIISSETRSGKYYQPNKVVETVLDVSTLDLNLIRRMQRRDIFDVEDFRQFLQLIGLSVSSLEKVMEEYEYSWECKWSKRTKLPRQPVVPADSTCGVDYHHPNRIVKLLLDNGPFDMNNIYKMLDMYPRDHFRQFLQLMGESPEGIRIMMKKR